MKKKATYHPEHRTHVITVRMNEDEWQMFQQRLQDSGMMQSDFVRQAVATAKVDVHIHSVYDSEVLDQIAAELGKIGSNMNQIASKNADYTVAEQYLIFSMMRVMENCFWMRADMPCSGKNIFCRGLTVMLPFLQRNVGKPIENIKRIRGKKRSRRIITSLVLILKIKSNLALRLKRHKRWEWHLQRNIFQGIRCWCAPMKTDIMEQVIFMFISY